MSVVDDGRENLPRLVVTPADDRRPRLGWVGRVVEQAAVTVAEVNAALFTELVRTGIRLVNRRARCSSAVSHRTAQPFSAARPRGGDGIDPGRGADARPRHPAQHDDRFGIGAGEADGQSGGR